MSGGVVNIRSIGSVHPSESSTIAAFHAEKGESQLDKKGPPSGPLFVFEQILRVSTLNVAVSISSY